MLSRVETLHERKLCSVPLNERAVFYYMCIVSILWVLTIFICEYVKRSMSLQYINETVYDWLFVLVFRGGWR